MTWPGRGSLRRIVGWAPPSRAGYRQEGRAAWDARRPRPPSAVVEGCQAISIAYSIPNSIPRVLKEGGGGGCGDGGEGGRPLTGEIMVERLRQIELHGNQPSWIGLCEPGLGGGRGAPPLGAGLLVATAVAVAVATSFTVRSASERREQMKRAMAGTGRLDLGEGPEIAPWKRPEEQESSRRVARDIYWNSNSWVK